MYIKNKKNPNNIKYLYKKGFTLIELLVVIFIIGVLAALVMPNLMGARQRAGDSNKKAGLRELKNALRLYYNDNQNYPEQTNSHIAVQDPDSSDEKEITTGEVFATYDGSTVYMKEVPEYKAYKVSTTDYEEYILTVELDNASDQDIQASRDKCAGSISKVDGSYDFAGDNANDYVVCED